MGNSKKSKFEIFDIGIMGSVYWGSAVWLRSGLRFVKKVPCIHSYRTCANSFWVCLWLVSDFYRKNKIFHRATFQVLSIENTDFSKKSEAKIEDTRSENSKSRYIEASFCEKSRDGLLISDLRKQFLGLFVAW